MNNFKCELCPREAMKNDILCFYCSVTLQSKIPQHESTAFDAIPIDPQIWRGVETIR